MARKRKPPATMLPLGDEVEQAVRMGFQPGLVDRYAIPPFSVLDARQGYWQARKSLWIALGIRSELGRGEGAVGEGAVLTYTDDEWSERISGHSLNYYREKGKSHASTPAPVGEGGLSDRLAPRPGKDRLDRASPGGSPRPAMDYSNRERGTGAGAPIPGSKAKGKADARAFGLDMMRGEGADRYEYVGKQRDRYGTDTTREYRKADDNVIPTGTGPAVFSDGAVNPYLARSRKPVTTRDAGRGAALNAPIHPYDDTEGEGEVSVMGTSIFDPVLTELLYCWFSPPGAQVLDPFAGGSVRGIVAAALGRHYTGIDLRPEQVAANEQQWERIGPGLPGSARWLTGDAADVLQLVFDPDREAFDPSQGDGLYDFILTCPPYFDLEQYSYDPADLSNAGDYQTFLRAFRDIIERSCSLLSDNRFAAVVVGDIRDERGFYRNFPAHTISLFQKYGGMTLYNEAILVTAVGSLPVRIGKQFEAGRKLGKTHQNILVFYKGDPKRIRDVLGEIQMGHSDSAEADADTTNG